VVLEDMDTTDARSIARAVTSGRENE
jgi:hypothetical protein